MANILNDELQRYKHYLPPGVLQNSPDVQKLFLAMMCEVLALKKYAKVLLQQTFASQASVCLFAHETDWGLPNPCEEEAPQILTERQKALLSKLSYRHGQKPVDYEKIAISLGYEDATVTDGEDTHHWNISINGLLVDYFHCGNSFLGIDPLGSGQSTANILCALAETKPAHTEVTTSYTT